MERTEGERRGKELLGMPVYTIQEGRRLGEVTTLLIRREDMRVVAIRIGSPLNAGPALAYADLQVVGTDALLVQSTGALENGPAADTVRAWDESVPGRPVITTSGQRVGTVAGFWIHTDTGLIAVFRVRPEAGFIARLAGLLRHDVLEVSVEQVQALGADALIVTDAFAAQNAPEGSST